MEKPKRKRLKVISACSECRRKKTKCNGQYPCVGCIKAHTECQYATTRHSPAHTQNNTVLPASPKIVFQSHFSGSNSSPGVSSIQAIEQRLSVIEDILQTLLSSSTIDPSALPTLSDRVKRLRSVSEESSHDSTGETHPPPPHASLEPRTLTSDNRCDVVQLPRPQCSSPTLRNLLNCDVSPIHASSPVAQSFGLSAFQRVIAGSLT